MGDLSDRMTGEDNRGGSSYDSGFCNPRKINQADEDREDAVERLVDEGCARREAEYLVDR